VGNDHAIAQQLALGDVCGRCSVDELLNQLRVKERELQRPANIARVEPLALSQRPD
jgi:hypothetical protein